MSYNIASCKVKSLNKLVIPAKEFTQIQEKYRPDIHINISSEIEICYGESIVSGTIDNGLITVLNVDIQGDGSNSFLYECLIPALRKSTGEISLRFAWEGDGEISRVKANNGNVTDITDED